jgi:iron only hydrogenase large subunit-like protein/PAS domain-containing protein
MIQSPVYTEITECQDCYKCIRKCPVKAIRVENSHARVIPQMCVSCGRCVLSCPSFAKRYRNDVDLARHLAGSGKKVFVSLAPSFAAEFIDWTPAQLVAAFKRLGFYAVSETALGADFLSARIAEDLDTASRNRADGAARLFISSACPTMVEYIKRYEKHLAPCVMPHASPLLTHARYLRARFGSDIGVAFVGPCIAKKREADIWSGEINVAITFAELREWFQKEHLTPQTVQPGEETFVPRRSAKGAFFPLDGGEILAWKAYAKYPVDSMAVSGLEAIQEMLKDFSPETLERPLFLELLACQGGCVNGPGVTGASPGIVRRVRLSAYAESADETLDAAALALSPPVEADFPVSPADAPEHTEEAIRAALRSVGKFDSADNLNCSSCGYESCRDFAAALLDSRAEKSQCASYMRNLATKKANGLIHAIPSGIVIIDRNLSIVECNQQFAKLMGSEIEDLYTLMPGLEGADLRKITPLAPHFEAALAPGSPGRIECDVRSGKKIFHLNVFSVEKGEIAAGVLEDITQPQIRIDKTVSRAREVIEKNVSTVQKIAFLLGENAAETEAILNSIIDSHTAREEDASDAP